MNAQPHLVTASMSPVRPDAGFSDVDHMRAAAVGVLLHNWSHGHTLPATGLYPHQWSWDSAFVAMGLRHVSPRRAAQELDSLLAAQWTDGRLPQIIFDSRRDDDYSPGAAFWRSERIPGSASVPTAGLIQPPVHAWAVLAVHRADPQESRRRRFLERAYPRLVAWHAYLRDRRHRGGAGLACIVHPWESGMDNSPLWDAALHRIADLDPAASTGGAGPSRPDLLHADPSERPTQQEYTTYLALAARYRDHLCDDTDLGFPFLVEDPAFNALWAVSERALASIATDLGRPAAEHRRRADAIGEALERLWDEALGCYVARDLVTGAMSGHATVSGLLPLLLPQHRRTSTLLATLRGPRFALGQVHLVPSHDLTSPGFDPARYWRGPSWFNTAWLIVQALRALDLPGDAQALAAHICIEAVAHDFPEYLDPLTGAPHGVRCFSWTAALALDLLSSETSALP